MGLNAIEIILDTSQNMGEIILDTTKLELAKSILKDLSDKWNKIDCNHELYIIYNQNFDIISLRNIEELKDITNNGQLPLSKVIDKSIRDLNNFNSFYKNRVIVIITDGRNNYDIKESINSNITIYTIEIVADSKDKNLTLSRLSEENSGIAYIYNGNIKEKNKIISKIKKYFKCKKKLSVILPIFFMFILPVILTFLYKGCNDISNINSLFTGCNNNHTKINGVLQGCSSTQYYSTPTPKKIKKDIESNITSCKTDNRIKQCFLISNRSVKAIIYDFYPNKKIIALINFASGMSEINNKYKTFLKEVLKESSIKKEIKNVQIIGHTDLEQVDKKKNYPFNKNCEIHHEHNNTNACLGKERAFQVEQVLKQTDYIFTKIITKYDDDFFLGHINEELNYTLWIHLNLEKKIDRIIKELNNKNLQTKYYYNIKKVRQDKAIQNKIRKNKPHYSEEFAPFRSVVLIIDNK